MQFVPAEDIHRAKIEGMWLGLIGPTECSLSRKLNASYGSS